VTRHGRARISVLAPGMGSPYGAMSMPAPLRKLFALFPLHVYPGLSVTSRPASPTLWIHPPNLSTSPRLSRDVECLKWQAYLALRGITDISLRWDISPDGGINGALPALHLPTGDLLGPTRIPAWVDSVLRSPLDELEGYRDEQSRDESRAWIALLEGVVHSALVHDPGFPSADGG
jgi:metaxin